MKTFFAKLREILPVLCVAAVWVALAAFADSTMLIA